MSYLITLSIILTFAFTLSIIFNKRIEEVIILGIVEIAIIIFGAGLLNNLKLGVVLVEILAVIQLIYCITQVIKKVKEGHIKQVIQNTFTPGLIIYLLLFVGNIIISMNRLLENFDEFTHWAVITKNMFVYNTYGVNPETIVRFNDYPPFTAIFQYFFLTIKGVYAEDIILIAQNLLYFSIVIPITKYINWDKSLKRLLAIIPLIIFSPMIFYKNFYLEIVVDGFLGIIFAYTIFSAYEKEENTLFKYIKILIGLVMLSLTKTSGIALAILATIIILIKYIIDKQKKKQGIKEELKLMSLVILITIILTSAWYIKVSKAKKMWNFSQYVTEGTVQEENKKETEKNFIDGVLTKQVLSEKNLTVVTITIIYVCFNIYTVKKKKSTDYTYYSTSMIASIPIYLYALLISYCAIFSVREAKQLACFDRYVNTILLAYAMFQVFKIAEESIEKKFKIKCCAILAIIIVLLPINNIQEKYIKGTEYIVNAKKSRENCTRIKEYENKIEEEDKILFITGGDRTVRHLVYMNKYEIMPLKIAQAMDGIFVSQDNFEKTIKKYDYVFIYKIREDQKEKIIKVFEDKEIIENKLYKVIYENKQIILKLEEN